MSMWQFHFAEQNLPIRDEDELREHLAPVREGRPGEVWLEDPAGGRLLLLSNGGQALLMHLPDMNGDHPGWTTRAAEDRHREDLVSGFLLGNGQMDEFPSSWVVPLREGTDAFIHFYTHGERAPWLFWHDDSTL